MTADQLAAAARRHPLRSPARRAAAHLWAALITSPTVSGARRPRPPHSSCSAALTRHERTPDD